MSLPEKIKTIKQSSEFKLKEKGSLFLCICEPVQTEEEAQNFLAKIRKQYYDATTHCYSYKFQNGTFKYSDDGEPNGTAGIRIYNAQNHFEVTNLVTAVVRYFGGTKLGVGPLGKAYYDSVTECLSNSLIEEKELFHKIELSYDFALSKTVHHFVSKFKLIISRNDFDTLPKMVCLVRPSQEKEFTLELTSASQNKIAIAQTGEFSYITLDSI